MPLPSGFVGSQLLVVGGRLVVGGSQGDAPALLVADSGGALNPISVTPVSFYGALARWYSISADGSQLRALGGRAGGGHGNPRWSTWTGDLTALHEQPAQGIEVFGGERGGGMVGVTVVDGQPVIVGGRAGSGQGLDIAVWLPQGDDWVEQSSTGTALAASARILPFPSSVVSDGSALLVTGFTQRLGGGKVRIVATAWTGSPIVSAAGDWQRLDLASDTKESRADAASCDSDRCVIVGHGDGRMLAWSDADGRVTRLALPRMAASTKVPAPLSWDGRTALVGTHAIAVSRDLRAWTLIAGPQGSPVAAASDGHTLFELLTEPDGTVELWRSDSTHAADTH